MENVLLMTMIQSGLAALGFALAFRLGYQWVRAFALVVPTAPLRLVLLKFLLVK